MKRHVMAMCGLAMMAMVPLQAGTIVGTVRAQGPHVEGGGGGGAYGSRKFKFVERIDYEALTDFVVSIEAPADVAPVGGAKMATVVQRDANFEPHVLAIAAGTTVRWPNEDDIYHNVFSMADAKPFDLKLYKKGDRVPEVTFEKAGRVDVFCGIHTEMHCIVLVLPNPLFAMADGRGRYRIEHVPAGTYRVRAWHERVPSQFKEVVVPAEGDVKVDFVLGVGGGASE